jgi:hypothetical protein
MRVSGGGIDPTCATKGKSANKSVVSGIEAAVALDTSVFDICNKKSQPAKSDISAGKSMGKFAIRREKVDNIAANSATNLERDVSPMLRADNRVP